MLSEYPTMLDSLQLPKMKTWSVSSNDIKNKYESEGGSDEEEIIRKDKLSISATVCGFSDLLKDIYEKKMEDELDVTLYDPITEDSVHRTMRITAFSYALHKDTDQLAVTNGIYDISFTLEEF